MGQGVRVQMVIDAPDDLYQLQSPPGLKEAVLHAHDALREDHGSPRDQQGRHRPDLPPRRIPGDEPVRHGRRARPLRPLGRRPAAHLPERRQLARHGGDPAGRHRHPALLPLRADPIRLEIREGHITSIEGGVDADADARLARRRQDERAGPRSLRRLAPRLGPESAVPLGLRSRCTATRPNAAAPRRAASRATSCSPPGRTRRAAASARTRGHYDVPMRGCTIALDGRVVVEDGRIVDPKMIVPRVKR